MCTSYVNLFLLHFTDSSLSDISEESMDIVLLLLSEFTSKIILRLLSQEFSQHQ